jgi:dienelactone hydrolase
MRKSLLDPVSRKVYAAALRAKLRRWAGGHTDPYLPLPPGTALSPSEGVQAALAAAKPALSFTREPEAEPAEWQRWARAKLAELAGYPDARGAPAVTHAAEPEDLGGGIERRGFYLRIRAETDLPVHVIRSRDLSGPAPVFLHLAGSTSGVHLGWGAVRVPIDHQRAAIGADMARQAAQRGYLAVAVEQGGYGERLERRLPKRSASRTADLANHLLLLGRSLMGDGAWDVSAAVDWLLAGGAGIEVDPGRLFLFGHSCGGTLAQFAAALDPRIAGVLASGSVGPVRQTIAARGAGGGDGIVPGLLRWLDTPDLIALVAPRPFVALSGAADHIFPAAGMEQAVEAARPFYARMNAQDRLHAVTAPGGHRYYSEQSWEAWQRWIDPA